MMKHTKDELMAMDKDALVQMIIDMQGSDGGSCKGGSCKGGSCKGS